jgi:hypothetical protein
LPQVKEIFAEDKQMAIEILHDIIEHEKKEKQSENVQRRQGDVSYRTSEHIPSRVNALLRSSSPWVRQSLGPEISRCYRVGGAELMMTFAHAKLQNLRNQTQQRSDNSRRSNQVVEDREDFIEGLKQEGTGDDGDGEARDAEEECEVWESVEEIEVRETGEEGFKDKENVEAEFGMRETEEQESEVRGTEVAVFEVRQNVEAEFGMRKTGEEESEVRETGVAVFEVRQTVEAEFGMRETLEENELGSIVGETAEDEVGEILEDDEVMETVGKKDGMELAFEEGANNAKSHVEETASRNMNGQDEDCEMPRTDAGIGTPNTRRGVCTVSTPIIPGEINVTFSSDVSAIDSDTLCFRPHENR